MRKNERFLKACRREPVDCTPIWLMRQAGRYMPAYRALRARHALLDMIKTPELATEVTLQPVHAFAVDAAIIFADILPLLESMGLPLQFISGRGPVIDRPVRSRADVAALRVSPPEEGLGFTLDAIRMVQAELAGRLPLLGFSGAPFTLACYAIEGGSSKDFHRVRALLREEPAAWHAFMEKLAEAVGAYLRAQVDAGADAVQLFDSWAGMLTPDEYTTYVLPHSRRAIALAREGHDAPFIHFATRGTPLLALLKEAGGTVLGVDWRVGLDEAWRLLGDEVALQGNLDPQVLLTDADQIRAAAARVLDQANGRPGHIFNLGHGVVKETPPEHVALLVDFVHAHSRTSHA